MPADNNMEHRSLRSAAGPGGIKGYALRRCMTLGARGTCVCEWAVTYSPLPPDESEEFALPRNPALNPII